MQRHQADPPMPFRAVSGFARLIAAGLMRRGECLDALAAPCGPNTRVRLAHALTDATLAWTARRALAGRALRAAIAPLLAARAPSARIRAAAHAANRAHGHPLRAAEVESLAAALAAATTPAANHGERQVRTAPAASACEREGPLQS